MQKSFTANLPGHMPLPGKIYVDEEALHTSMARKVIRKLPGIPVKTILAGQDVFQEETHDNSLALYLKHYRGKFLRPCPATRTYQCCGYQIIHIGENCPLNCSYCILQAYFHDQVLKVWANQNDLWSELDSAFGRDKNRLFRVGTGEFTDSLALEHLTEYSSDLVAFLENYPNVRLELKSKIIDLTWMKKTSSTRGVLPAWSVNSPDIVSTEEKGASTLEERLRAARYCADQGFRVCLHFDPIIHYPGWEKGYSRTVQMILDYLKPENIAYISLGSFRYMPGLKDLIMRNHPGSTYIYNEFITGMDGKTRLLLPLRLEQFRHIAGKLKHGGLSSQLYFCMESDLVWKDVLGCTPKELGGLAKHLLRLSFQD
ncbi:MAG: radical SAM protein [Desulfonatronovibrio sp.]